jgi:hypothetical protein
MVVPTKGAMDQMTKQVTSASSVEIEITGQWPPDISSTITSERL